MESEEPSTRASDSQVLITTRAGSIGVVTPLNEAEYRRLSAMQIQLANTLDHPCGLNPRTYRSVETDSIGGRGLIDGSLVRKWLALSSQRRKEIASRVGAAEWELRKDLDVVLGSGLGFL